MGFKLAIFDLDGTLVDTMVDITNALNHALMPHGIYPMTHDETEGLVGEGLTALVQKVLGPERGHLKKGVIDEFLKYYSAHLVDFSKPYPGVVETLDNLRGVRMAVVSNKREALSTEMLKELGLLKHFESVVGSDTVGAKKPSPEPVLHVLKGLEVQPEEAVIIGDSDYDIQAGKGAGIRTVAVTYGYRPREVLEGADHVIDNFQEVSDILLSPEVARERRKHTRHPMPDKHRGQVQFCIESPGGLVTAELVDFSRNGVRLNSDVPFILNQKIKCEVFMPSSFSKVARFTAEVKFCSDESGGNYVIGAEILEVEDEIWFRVFKRIYDYIVERRGEVY